MNDTEILQSLKTLQNFKKELFKYPHAYLPSFLQGFHTPERQIFMSATVDMIDPSETTIEIIEIGAYAGSSMMT
jgi:predicted O-methyltransferase YrrM